MLLFDEKTERTENSDWIQYQLFGCFLHKNRNYKLMKNDQHKKYSIVDPN